MPPLLQINNVTMAYGGGLLSSDPPFIALDSFNLDLYETPARITTVAGESGSGKTMLANLILGFAQPTHGIEADYSGDVSPCLTTAYPSYFKGAYHEPAAH